MLIELIITILALLVVLDYFVKKRRNDILGDMPGPRAYPLFGNTLLYWDKSPEDMIDYILQNRIKYGPIYRVWILNQLAIFSCDYRDVEVVLSSQKHITKNRLYDVLHPWLGNGLLLSAGQKWHSRRKIITPTFHFKILEQFVDVFNQQSAVLVKKLRPMADGTTEFDIQPFICLEALDIIAETAMGTKLNAQTDSDCEYVRAVNEITNILAKRFVSVWQRNEFIFSVVSPFIKIRQTKAIKVMHAFTERIIKERRKTLNTSLENGSSEKLDDDSDVGEKKRMALLDVLLQSTIDGKPLSNNDIREEVDTFMFEGHDTTTSAMMFTLYLISRHPEVQQKAFEEIVEVLGNDKDSPVGYRDLQNLKYLECVIKEALRLYPSVPIIGRYFHEDVKLSDRIIPAGTNYSVGIFAMLREPDVFPDPHTFLPERHTLENSTEKQNPYAYIPFSAGPRNCIGQKFAMLEMKSTVSKVLRHYELLALGPAIRPVMNLVLRSANGAHLGLRERVY